MKRHLSTIVFGSLGLCAGFALCYVHLVVPEREAKHSLSFPPQALPDDFRAKETSVPAGDQRSAAYGDSTKSDNTNAFSEKARRLLSIGQVNLKEAINFINIQYPEEDRDGVIVFLLFERAKDRLDAVTEVIPYIKTKAQQRTALERVAEYWVKKDTEELLRFAHAQSNPTTKNLILEKTARHLATDKRFKEATQVIEQMPLSQARSAAIGAVAERSAAGGNDDVITWAMNLPSADDVARAQRAVFFGLKTRQDVPGLQRLLENAPLQLQSLILPEIGRLAAQDGIDRVRALTFADPKQRQQVILAAMETAPVADVSQLLNEVVSFNDAYLRDRAISTYVQRVFEEDPRAAIQWVTQAPQEMRESAVSVLVANWYDTDFTAVSEWVNGLPTGKDRDVAFASLALKLASSDPEYAKQVAAQIGDSLQRARVLKSIR